MSMHKFFLVASIAVVSIGSGCKAGFLSGDTAPPVAAQPQAQAPPVVVEGMRVSYADVVEKTSPAVVRIEADHKEKPQSQTQFPGDDLFKQFGIPMPGQPGQPGPSQRPQIERGLGSGVVVAADGSILTNFH